MPGIDTGLKNKVVVVTGGGQGIGLATAEAFAAQEAVVIIADMKGSQGAGAADQLVARGMNVSFLPLDVTSEDGVGEFFENTVPGIFERYVDVLVNNAGVTDDSQLVKIAPDGEVIKMSLAQWRKVIEVNLTGSWLCARDVLPGMIRRRSGVILFASSVIARDGGFGQTNYAASKCGIEGVVASLSREVGKYGVRVNAVAPGYTQTSMMDTVPDDVLAKLAKSAPLRRLGNPGDIANAYVSLASDQSRYITGAVLSVDGGLRV